MATPLALAWDLIARDGASPAFNRVAASADRAAASTDRAAASAGVAGKKMLAAFAGLAAVDLAVHFVKDAVQFQKSMLLIQTQAGASAAEVKKMSGALLGLAGSVGTGPEQLATSLYHVESTGMRGAAALQAVKIAAEGAKIGNANLEETTNALTSALVSGISGVQSMSGAMGSLNAIVGTGDMSLENLNEALGTGILKVAKGFGLSLSDAGAALADFGDNNIRGADAASQLRQAIMALAKPVQGGTKQLQALGIGANQLRDDMAKGGLLKALEDLKGHLTAAGVTGSAVGGVLLNAFGKKAGVGIAIMVDDLTRIEQKEALIKAGATGFGQAWTATQGTASFALSSIVAEFQAGAIVIGDKLLPAVTSLARFLGDELPKAGHDAALIFGPIGKGAETIGSALAPIGSILSSIKGPLTAVAVGALAMFAAFKAGEAIAAILATVGSAMETLALKAMYAGDAIVAAGTEAEVGWAGLAGPLGIAAVGVIALVSLFHKSSDASKEAASAAKAYTEALKSGSSADLADSIIGQLKDNKVPETIAALNKQLGSTKFSGSQFVTAIQSQGGALAALKAHLQDVMKATTGYQALSDKGTQYSNAKKLLDDLNIQANSLSAVTEKELADARSFGLAASSIDTVSNSLAIATGTAQTYAAMLGILVNKDGVAYTSQVNLTNAIKLVTSAYASATQTGNTFLGALQTFAGSAGTAADRAALIGATLVAGNGDMLNYANAMNGAASAGQGFVTSIQQAAAAVGKNGESTKAYLDSIVNLTTGTINYNNAAAAPLISSMQSIQTAAMNAAEAVYQHNVATEGGKKAADDAYATYQAYTSKQFTDEATKLGLTNTQAQALARTYFGMPSDVKTKIESEGTDPILTVLTRIGQILAQLAHTNWAVTVTAYTSDAEAQIARVKADLNDLHGQSVYVAPGPGGGKQKSGKAAGGMLPQGFSSVGEKGTELAYTSGGKTMIFSHAQAAAMNKSLGLNAPGFASGTDPGGPITINYGGKGGTSSAAAGGGTVKTVSSAVSSAAKGIASAIKAFTTAVLKSTSTTDDLKSAISTLTDAAKTAGVSSSRLAAASKLEGALLKDASKRDALNAKLGTAPNLTTTAYDKFTTALDNFNNEKSTVAGAIKGGFNIQTAGQYQFGDLGTFTNYSTTMQTLQDQIKQASAFSANLAALTAKAGNSAAAKEIISGLAEGGPSASGAETAALAGASKAQIAALVAAQAKLDAIANSTAQKAATAVDGQALKAAQDQVNLLKALIATLDKQIPGIGAQVAAALNGTARTSSTHASTVPAGR